MGFTTFQINKHLESFYDRQIQIIFDEYREELRNNMTSPSGSHSQEFDFFYKPRPYYIFGKFDLAFVSLIEDFEICGRSFRPFNGKTKGSEDGQSAQPFDYKILAGNFSSINHAKKENYSKNIHGTLNNKLPFIAICNLKINNALLLRYGFKSLNVYFQDLHRSFKESDFLKNEKNQGKLLDTLLFETVGSYEFTLLLFSNSYELISSSLIKLREMHFESDEEQFHGCPFFEHSNVTYGFDLELFKENLKTEADKFIFEKSFVKPPVSEQLSLNTRWFVKPGVLRSLIDEKEIRISLGYGNVVAHTRDYQKIEKVLNLLMKAYRNLLKDSSLSENTFESRSLPVIKFSDPAITKIIEEIGDFSPMETEYLQKNKHNWLLSELEIRKIEVDLRELGTAKIIRNKVVKILSNYNNIVSNPLLYIYFLDLSIFCKVLLKTSLENYKIDLKSGDLTINQLNKTLRTSFLNIENAYANRFFQSSVAEDITDINSEYFGAIHQSISGFDFAYKVYNGIFEGGISSNILIVGSSPRIESTKYFIRVNYFHVFQPEIFAAICCHESTNYFFDKIGAHMLFSRIGDTDLVTKQKKLLQEGMEALKEFGFKTESYTNSRGDMWKEKPHYNEQEIGHDMMDYLRGQDDYFLHQEFIETYFHPHLDVLKYFIKDIITLKMGYCDKRDLFSKWHWSYFLQIPMNYDNEGKVREEKFCIFFLRMTFALSEIKPSGFKNFYEGQFKAPHRIFQRHWDKNFQHVQWIFDTIFSNNPLARKLAALHRKIESFSEQLVIYGDNKNRFGSEKSYSEIIEGTIGKDWKHIDYVINSFKNGEILTYDPTESFYMQVSRLNISILKYHYDQWLGKDNLLDRDHGEAILNRVLGNMFTINPEIQYSDVLVDRQGGLFSFNFDTRKELLRIRTTFIKSLWELSLHKKREDFISEQH